MTVIEMLGMQKKTKQNNNVFNVKCEYLCWKLFETLFSWQTFFAREDLKTYSNKHRRIVWNKKIHSIAELMEFFFLIFIPDIFLCLVSIWRWQTWRDGVCLYLSVSMCCMFNIIYIHYVYTCSEAHNNFHVQNNYAIVKNQCLYFTKFAVISNNRLDIKTVGFWKTERLY